MYFKYVMSSIIITHKNVIVNLAYAMVLVNVIQMDVHNIHHLMKFQKYV